MILAVRTVPDLRLARRHRLDTAGVALATLGLTGVVFGLIEGQRYDWGAVAGSPVTIPEVTIAGPCCWRCSAYGSAVGATPSPWSPAAVFRDKAVALLCVLAAAQFGLISIMILAAINMQSVLGYSAVISGLTSLPLSIRPGGGGRKKAGCAVRVVRATDSGSNDHGPDRWERLC